VFVVPVIITPFIHNRRLFVIHVPVPVVVSPYFRTIKIDLHPVVAQVNTRWQECTGYPATAVLINVPAATAVIIYIGGRVVIETLL
jgi:hypothetical protein